MSVDLKNLTSRKLTASDLQAEARWLADQFIVDGKETIKVGEGVAIGPFENEVQGKNFLVRHLGEAIDILEKDYGWGKTKTANGKRAQLVKYEPRPIAGNSHVEMWIKRTKE